MPEIPEFYYRSLPESGEFHTAAGLHAKTDGEKLLPFRGETSVFLLTEDVCRSLKVLQDRIYSAAGDMLCGEKLREDSFHMTLHDLWNESDKRSCPTYSHEQVMQLLRSVREDYPNPIKMHAVSLLSMVCTSVVLGLVPADDASEAALADMYSRMQSVWPLSYGLTPHITLAYYRPGTYPEQLWRRLGEAFAIEPFEFSLAAESLVFQSFEDMNKYRTI